VRGVRRKGNPGRGEGDLHHKLLRFESRKKNKKKRKQSSSSLSILPRRGGREILFRRKRGKKA